MALRLRKVALLGSLALLAAASLAMAGPLTETAGANACHRWGDDKPRTLNHRHARKAIRCLLNRARHRHGLSRVHRDHRLARAAQRHTEYMNGHGCFSHQCSGEASLPTRLHKTNYLVSGLRSWLYGENIAWGERRLGTPRAMARAWMHSPEHRANILNSGFRDLGVGFDPGRPGARGANAGTYTTDFGQRSG
jgi:uncharacterized protein YkwD